jgi:uncharacterized membrane protein
MTAGTWWALAVGLLTPVAMIGCYPVFRFVARRPPNPWSGYRTERAASSQQAWTLAQELCARLWVRYGLVFAVITLLGYGVLYASGNRDTDTWMWVALVCAR